jgi:hypothetical protein
MSDDQLYSELGHRLQAINFQPELSGNFDLRNKPSAQAMGVVDDLRTFGKAFFTRVNQSAYELVCGSDADASGDRDKIMAAIGMSPEATATALAAALGLHLGLAPALAPVVALLVVRLFFQPTHDAMCALWKTKVAPPAPPPPKAGP